MPLRIGILGAARIAPAAIVRPARHVAGAEVVAVGARDFDRARAFALRQDIDRAVGSYSAVIDDPGVDAVYNPLPNGLHGRWTLAALDAGKHVLCEKPFTANAEEAELVAERAASSGLVVMEAFHYRYHPLAARMIEILASGELGELRHIEVSFCFPLLRPHDIRWNPDLAPGAMMDAGCYAVHIVRMLGAGEPQVASAKAQLWKPGIDRAMEAELSFPSGVSAHIRASMFSARLLAITARAICSGGEVKAYNPLSPQYAHRLVTKTATGRRVETLTRRPTYEFQLDAFVAAVADGAPTLTPPADSIANMRVIDSIYRAAGLEPRQPT